MDAVVLYLQMTSKFPSWTLRVRSPSPAHFPNRPLLDSLGKILEVTERAAVTGDGIALPVFDVGQGNGSRRF
jgi:hypothetical protein